MRTGFLLLLMSVFLLNNVTGQKSGTIIITGRVYNTNYEPVPGAVLFIDKVRTSTMTDEEGSYRIRVSTSAINLMAGSPEFGLQEKPIEGKKKIDFILSPDGKGGVDSTGKAVIVGEKKKSIRKGKKLNAYNDIYQMIRAEVSGVVVSGKNIQIRQGHSFFGSSAPLFVVNGNIVNSIDFVNPLEVKSISVLKGSAAAIYGDRGSNGVLSINLIDGSDAKKEREAMANSDEKGNSDVNIGYGTVKEKDLTTPVSRVDVGKQKTVYKDIYDMLKGHPGVQVNGRKVIIQGASSIMSSTDPLFVVDGVVTNNVDDINPQTVKSIEILKGASAAIYGSRGANGVILITLLGAR